MYYRIAAITAFIYSLEAGLSGCKLVVVLGNAVNTSQVYNISTGETAKLFWPRSDREGLNEFKEYRAWRDGVAFAIIKKGKQNATCPDDVLQQFCLKKTEFKIWNMTHLLLEVNNTTFDDRGNYTVEHVFRWMEANHKDKIILKVVAKPTSTVKSPSQCSSTKAKSRTPNLTRTSSKSSSVQSVVLGGTTTTLQTHHTSELSTTTTKPSARASSGGISFNLAGRPFVLLLGLLFLSVVDIKSLQMITLFFHYNSSIIVF
ncbi:uncharacterized protein LOC144654747 isoform X2 [Oculina patagonica]